MFATLGGVGLLLGATCGGATGAMAGTAPALVADATIPGVSGAPGAGGAAANAPSGWSLQPGAAAAPVAHATTPALAVSPDLAVSGSAPPAPGGAPMPSYRLGPNDRVTISVYGEDDLSREYVVSPSGTISLPLIGEVVARGRTADDLRDEITRRLSDGFLNSPTVTLMITAFRNFYILGEVNKPGEYAYESGLTVTQAVAEAAGYTYRAARRWAFIRHEGERTETRVPITADLPVQPGDTIRLGERYF